MNEWRINIMKHEDYIEYISRLNVGDIIECDIIHPIQESINCTITSTPEIGLSDISAYTFNISGYSHFTRMILIYNMTTDEKLFISIYLTSNNTDTYLLINPDTIKINGKSINEVLGYNDKYICY